MVPLVITGDTHGEDKRLFEIYNVMQKYKAEKEKYICVLGDFGYLMKDDFFEKKLLDEIEGQDFVFIVIPGNHDNYKAFGQYEVVDFKGAKAHRVRKNIFYIRRGEIMEIGGRFFFCMGGGNSVNKHMARKNVTYWEEEMPTAEEYEYAMKKLQEHKNAGKKIDYILSHAPSLAAVEELGRSHGQEEYVLNSFLEKVIGMVKDEYTMHFFGHLHVDKKLDDIKARALWFDYAEIAIEK